MTIEQARAIAADWTSGIDDYLSDFANGAFNEDNCYGCLSQLRRYLRLFAPQTPENVAEINSLIAFFTDNLDKTNRQSSY